MPGKTVAEFCKSGICPSAETLLRFDGSELFLAEMMTVSAHLAECEFCSTELYFLTSFPLNEKTDCGQTPKMPFALNQLAEALLGGRETEFRHLDNLLYSNEQLTLKDA